MEHIKKRVEQELHTWPSEIYDYEIKKLQKDQGITALAIAEYTRGYSHYKSCYDAIRNKLKPKLPKEFDEFTFEGSEYEKFKRTIGKDKFIKAL